MLGGTTGCCGKLVADITPRCVSDIEAAGFEVAGFEVGKVEELAGLVENGDGLPVAGICGGKFCDDAGRGAGIIGSELLAGSNPGVLAGGRARRVELATRDSRLSRVGVPIHFSGDRRSLMG